MTRRYTAEEADLLLRRDRCVKRGHHITGFMAAPGWVAQPGVYEREWNDEDGQCLECDALVSVEWPGPIGVEVAE